jgi:hypothetical protein
MADTLIEVGLHPLLKLLFTNDVANVFVDKVVFIDVFPCSDSKAFLFSLHDFDWPILTFLKTLILAVSFASTVTCETLDLRQAVDAARMRPASCIDIVLVFLGGKKSAGTECLSNRD